MGGCASTDGCAGGMEELPDDEFEDFAELPPYRKKLLERQMDGSPKSRLKQRVHDNASELADLKCKSAAAVAHRQRRAEYQQEEYGQQQHSEPAEAKQAQHDRWKIASGGNSRSAKVMEGRVRSESLSSARPSASPRRQYNVAAVPSLQMTSPSKKFEAKNARHPFGLINVHSLKQGLTDDDEYFFWKGWNSAHFRHSPSKLASIKVPWVSAERLTAQLIRVNMRAVGFQQGKSDIEGHFVGELDAPTITNALSALSIHDLIAVNNATRPDSVVPRVTVMARVSVNTTTWRMQYELKTEVPFIMQGFAQYFHFHMIETTEPPPKARRHGTPEPKLRAPRNDSPLTARNRSPSSAARNRSPSSTARERSNTDHTIWSSHEVGAGIVQSPH